MGGGGLKLRKFTALKDLTNPGHQTFGRSNKPIKTMIYAKMNHSVGSRRTNPPTRGCSSVAQRIPITIHRIVKNKTRNRSLQLNIYT